MTRLMLIAAIAVVALTAIPATAHVTVQPHEARAESVERFVVGVPNEGETASTIKVQVDFPPLASVSFEDVGGWDRQVKMRKLDEPLDALGEEVREIVSTVTWRGGEIEPGEFVEFPFSSVVPAGVDKLQFHAVQTHSDGEVDHWGHGDKDEHAVSVRIVDLGDIASEGCRSARGPAESRPQRPKGQRSPGRTCSGIPRSGRFLAGGRHGRR